MGLVAPRHVGSSQTRDRTRVPCIGRRILNHCATREVLKSHSGRVLSLQDAFQFIPSPTATSRAEGNNNIVTDFKVHSAVIYIIVFNT